jgi:thiol-disulfide isomerase/thioredoxin
MMLVRTCLGSAFAWMALTACGASETKGRTPSDEHASPEDGATAGDGHALMRKKAPPFKLKLASGGSYKPSDGAGKVVVLDFWATWCAPCKASFPKLDALYRRHKSEEFMFVGVNEDEAGNDDAIRAFLAETGATFPIALDSKQKIAEKYRVDAMPSTFVIDKKGIVRFVHDGSHTDSAKTIEREVKQLLAADDDESGAEE